MSSEDIKYYYQFFRWPKRKGAKKAKYADWEIFLHHIHVISIDPTKKTPLDRLRSYPDFVKDNLQLLEDFATHILGNIHWYEKKIVNEKTLRLAYILISLSLLLLVPILVAFIQEKSNSVSAQITAIFTGFFALYQGVSKWLESRNVIATYWQTSSNLKSRLYSLEDKWTYKYSPNANWKLEDLEELQQDLRKAVRFGIDSQKTEKQMFFDNYSYPQFNILGSIIGVRGQVQELFKEDHPKRDRHSSYKTSSPPRKKLAQLTEIADEPTQDRIGENDAILPIAGQIPSVPRLISRKDWGALPPKSEKAYRLGETKSIVIHHAAGYWDGNTNGKAQLRAIQKLHQNERKWMDIGYHFLVDPLGNIYQGREFFNPDQSLGEIPELIRGAHVGDGNMGRIGICLLGNYEPGSSNYTNKPTLKAQIVIIKLVSFLVDRYNPEGEEDKDGQVILGHKDFKSTSCPGEDLYEWLDELRSSVVGV